MMFEAIFSATLNNRISVGGKLAWKYLVWATLISSQGGINVGPRPRVFPQVFMKTSDQHKIRRVLQNKIMTHINFIEKQNIVAQVAFLL